MAQRPRGHIHTGKCWAEHPLTACLESEASAGTEPFTVCYSVAKLSGWIHFSRILGSWAVDEVEHICGNFISDCFFKLSSSESTSYSGSGVFTSVIPALGRMKQAESH